MCNYGQSDLLFIKSHEELLSILEFNGHGYFLNNSIETNDKELLTVSRVDVAPSFHTVDEKCQSIFFLRCIMSFEHEPNLI